MDSPVKSQGRLRQCVEKRWPLSPVMRWGSVEEIPGGAKFAYVLGSATMVLFGVLVITGVWQLLYYVPTVDHAYDSLMYLRLQVPFGWLVHGLHYWSAQAFIVVMGLHMARVFIWAAYKKPRELTWVLGVVLLLLGAAFIVTGAILPWDGLGYWAGEVGTSMAGTVPLIGKFLKLLMTGGDTMGQMTLSRAFVVHVALLPALTILFIAAHLVAFRQFGSVGPWKPKKPEKTGSFWPDQTFKDLLVVAVILMGLIWLSAFVRAPISGPADPLDNSYAPKPEWNFLFLYEALKAFKGSWEWIGTVVIPMLLVLLLFAVPFIDRNEKRNPFKRPIAMLSGFAFVAVILVMTFVGHYSNSGVSTPASASAAPTPNNQRATPSASAPTPATPGAALTASTNASTTASAAPIPTNQVATPVASAPTPATPGAALAVSTNASTTASAAPMPTNQVATPVASAPSPATPEAASSVSTNTLATASAPPAPTNQVATPVASAPSPAAPKQDVVPSQTNAITDNAPGPTNQSPTYLGDVQPIFAASCGRCHNPQTIIFNWLKYKSAFADRVEIRRRIWDSWKGRYCKEAMPPPNSPEALAFTDAERLTIRNWVDGNGGAVLGVAPAPAASAPTNQVAASATLPGSSQTNTTAPVSDVQAGSRLFVSVGCVACHKMEGKGGVAGPDLSHEASLGRSSQWLMTQISDPLKHVPTTIMPAHKNLTTPQLKSLADFILNPSPGQAPVSAQPLAAAPPVATNAPAAVAVGRAPTNQVAASANSTALPAKPNAASPVSTNAPTGDSREGSGLFVSTGCVTCHMIECKGGKVGPDLSQEATLGRSSKWLMTQITDPIKHVPTSIMPAHKNLTQPQLKSLADFILNPSSSPAALMAGTNSNAETLPSATSSTPGQEKGISASSNSAPPSADAPVAPSTVVKMIGDPGHGAILFDLDCAKCHGKAGEGKVPNPGSQAGVVAALAPISRGLFSDDPVVFAENIDRFIQQGATPPGPNPALQMPAFGTTHSLTVQETANIEAYVLSLNGVDAAKIIHPGIKPSLFVEGTAALFVLALLAISGLWIRGRASSSAQTGGPPTPQEFQALKHEVANL
jgi:ubiquinol-cytochrome c reductase cytochrome b subunit